MPLTSIHPTQLAFVNAVKPWARSSPYARTVGDFETWFATTYPGTTLVFKDWKGDTVADPDPAWYISCAKVRWEFSPPFDCVTEYPPDSFTITINEQQVRCQSGGPGGPIVPCPDASCVYTLEWTYEAGTTYDTSGLWTWADNVGAPGLYNAGWSGAAFGYNGLTNDELAGATHLPVTEGQTVTLSLLGNNRSSSPGPSNSEYVISWYVSTVAVTAFASDVILTTGAGNVWVEYSETAVAPAGAAGFSILMPRQCGQDNVSVCVADAS